MSSLRSREPARAAGLHRPARDSRADRDRASARGPCPPLHGLPDRSGSSRCLAVARALLSLFVTMGSQAGIGPFLLAYFVLTWGYGAFCEGLFNGQTVGKRAMGIRVVSERGVPISGAQAVLRNLVGSVDGLVPFFYQTALASMILSSKFQRLGDLAAGTMVVDRRAALAARGHPDRRSRGCRPAPLAAQPDRRRFRPGPRPFRLRRGPASFWPAPPRRDGRAAGQAPEKAVRALRTSIPPMSSSAPSITRFSWANEANRQT